MGIYKFKNKKHAEIVMLGDHAEMLFKHMGRDLPPQGAIDPEDLPELRARLIAAINQEQMAQAQTEPEAEEAEVANGPKAIQVSLEQRAYPLLKMMETAELSGTQIYWGF